MYTENFRRILPPPNLFENTGTIIGPCTKQSVQCPGRAALMRRAKWPALVTATVQGILRGTSVHLDVAMVLRGRAVAHVRNFWNFRPEQVEADPFMYLAHSISARGTSKQALQSGRCLGYRIKSEARSLIQFRLEYCGTLTK